MRQSWISWEPHPIIPACPFAWKEWMNASPSPTALCSCAGLHRAYGRHWVLRGCNP